jgi:hypothetical protein
MLKVLTDTPFFTFSPHNCFLFLFLVIANISYFVFGPCCFILVFAKFVYFEIGPYNI